MILRANGTKSCHWGGACDANKRVASSIDARPGDGCDFFGVPDSLNESLLLRLGQGEILLGSLPVSDMIVEGCPPTDVSRLLLALNSTASAATPRVAQGTHIMDLPDECVLAIFERIDVQAAHAQLAPSSSSITLSSSCITTSFACAPVCRRWRSLAEEAVQRLHLHGREICCHVLSSVRRFWNLRSFSLLQCSLSDPDGLLEVVSDSCPLLTTLQLCFISHRVSNRGLASLARGCTSLRDLVLEDSLQEDTSAAPLLQMTALERITLSDCAGIGSLPVSPSSHPNLHRLEILDLPRLWNLPSCFAEFSQLEELVVIRCPLAQLPEDVGKLSGLRKLVLSAVPLDRLPNSFAELACLEELTLERLHYRLGVDWFPESLAGLKSLRHLRMWECWGLSELPASLGSLPRLEELKLGASNGTWNLTSLPASLGNLHTLKRLFLDRITGLTFLPDSLGALSSLEMLHICDCRKLRALPRTLCSIKSLETLELLGNDSLEELPRELGNVQSLRQVYVQNCKALVTLPFSIGRLKGLTTLDLQGCTKLSYLPESIGRLSHLESLMLRWCSDLLYLPCSAGQLRNLRRIHLEGCEKLVTIPHTLEELEHLETLSCESCPNLMFVPRLRFQQSSGIGAPSSS